MDGASLAVTEMEKPYVIGEVISGTAFEEFLQRVFADDSARVESLTNALYRYTPATLLYIPEWYLDNFLVEMSPDLLLVYDAEADLRAVRAALQGEK